MVVVDVVMSSWTLLLLLELLITVNMVKVKAFTVGT